ncbi:DDE-type integrase/transposase/recombinase [Ruoffia tabacinasalis]
MGLKSHIRRSNGYSTKTSYINIEENILNREFSAEKPNEKWVTDITHMTYGFGNKAYLSAIKDLYDGSIVTYQVSRNNDNPLVMKTLEVAIDEYCGRFLPVVRFFLPLFAGRFTNVCGIVYQ